MLALMSAVIRIVGVIERGDPYPAEPLLPPVYNELLRALQGGRFP
jgi:hypothetical protein